MEAPACRRYSFTESAWATHSAAAISLLKHASLQHRACTCCRNANLYKDCRCTNLLGGRWRGRLTGEGWGFHWSVQCTVQGGARCRNSQWRQ
jgi:hypothetical protein